MDIATVFVNIVSSYSFSKNIKVVLFKNKKIFSFHTFTYFRFSYSFKFNKSNNEKCSNAFH